MRKVILLLVALMVTVVSFAQRTVRGTVVEQDTQEAVIQATASLLKGEKVVANAVTNTEGGFSIKAPEEGSYTLQVTYVGFKTYKKKITLKDGKDYGAGTIKLEPDAIPLKSGRQQRSVVSSTRINVRSCSQALTASVRVCSSSSEMTTFCGFILQSFS